MFFCCPGRRAPHFNALFREHDIISIEVAEEYYEKVPNAISKVGYCINYLRMIQETRDNGEDLYRLPPYPPLDY